MTDDDDLLAAEFALGLLEPGEAEAVQVRARSDAPLSLRIAWWRDQLAPLVREAEAEPPEGLWQRIAARLPENDNTKTLMQRWRAAAFGATTVAAALLVFIGTRPALSPPVVPPAVAPSPLREADPLVATLADPKSRTVVTVSYDRTSGRMTVAPAALDARDGDAELWVIPADGTPRSLGVIATDRAQRQAAPEQYRALIGAGATLAVSLEPKGGSPAAGPTGPVVVSGKIISI